VGVDVDYSGVPPEHTDQYRHQIIMMRIVKIMIMVVVIINNIFRFNLISDKCTSLTIMSITYTNQTNIGRQPFRGADGR